MQGTPRAHTGHRTQTHARARTDRLQLFPQVQVNGAAPTDTAKDERASRPAYVTWHVRKAGRRGSWYQYGKPSRSRSYRILGER